ncbi:MAG: hypothetical protein ACTSRC_21115 [Candidatus Helarchaeota archaeon]
MFAIDPPRSLAPAAFAHLFFVSKNKNPAVAGALNKNAENKKFKKYGLRHDQDESHN